VVRASAILLLPIASYHRKYGAGVVSNDMMSIFKLCVNRSTDSETEMEGGAHTHTRTHARCQQGDVRIKPTFFFRKG
jgi:hypothetical protein